MPVTVLNTLRQIGPLLLYRIIYDIATSSPPSAAISLLGSSAAFFSPPFFSSAAWRSCQARTGHSKALWPFFWHYHVINNLAHSAQMCTRQLG